MVSDQRREPGKRLEDFFLILFEKSLESTKTQKKKNTHSHARTNIHIQAFVLPFYNVFLNSHGITAAQLGLLAALRPAIGAPAAAGISALADRTGRHRAVLATCFTLAALGRLAVPLEPGNFPWQLGLALATEVVAAPVSVIADAAVVAAAPTEDG